MDINDKITDLLSRWEKQALPIDKEWRESLAAAEEDGYYMNADEIGADRGEVFAYFAEEAIDLLQEIKAQADR